MIFTYKKWDDFCKKLKENNIVSIKACDVSETSGKYLVLKHDVETNVKKALKMAKIENKYGHNGVFYVQAYLLKSKKNIKLLKKIQHMGHEVSYHYDVMDSCKGNLDKAIYEFDANLKLFKDNGFVINTLCQHGNPLVTRINYTSNRDFFRSIKVQEKYMNLSDIMVNYKEKFNTDYKYYSDAGRVFNMIYDPINNDIIKSDDKNISYKNLDVLLTKIVDDTENSIVSTHPHRWTNFSLCYIVKTFVFKMIRIIAKLLYKVPFLKKVMNKYYYLAKKI